MDKSVQSATYMDRMSVYSRPTSDNAHPPGRITERDEIHDALLELGVKVHASKKHLYGITIEIVEGPIRLVKADSDTIECTVPDSRIQPDFQDVEICSVRVKSVPVFGRVKEVRWIVLDGENYASRVADSLSKNGAVAKAIITGGSDVKISPSEEGVSQSGDLRPIGWVLTLAPENDDEGISEDQMRKWEVASSLRQQWDCYQTIAKALLSMPMGAED